MTNLLYRYPTLYPGVLLKRYKRFLADVELASGEVVTAHCPNTGPMTGVCTVGSPVQLSKSDNPQRKLAYTWELIQVFDNEPTWVGVNTGVPNKIIKLALQTYLFPQLGKYSEVKGEVVYGQDRKSRVDFFLSHSSPTNNLSNTILENDAGNAHRPIYLEVKNTTLASGKLALFPDTVTTRGQKHLRELMALLPHNRSVMLYFINRSDCTAFAPGDRTDPVYGKLLREAVSMGVEVLPCRFQTTPEGISYMGLADLQLELS